MIGKPEIRKIGVAEAKVLHGLAIRTFVDAFGPVNTKEDMDKYVAEEMGIGKLCAELADEANTFYLATHEGIPAGYAKVRLNQKDAPECAKAIEIERLYVAKEMQNLQIGGTLMRQCLDHGREQGCDMIWLGVWEHNHNAIRFYERWGFELYGKHPFLLGNDLQTDVLMKRKL